MQVFESEIRMAFQKRTHDPVILLPGHGAGTIDQNAPGFQPGRDVFQNRTLNLRQSDEILGLTAPLGFRVAVQDAQTGTGRVEEDPVKEIIKGKEKDSGGIRFDGPDNEDSQTGAVFPDEPDFGTMEVQCEDFSPIFHELGQVSGLSPGSGTNVQHPIAGSGVEQMGDQLGSLILHKIQPLLEEVLLSQERALLQNQTLGGELG